MVALGVACLVRKGTSITQEKTAPGGIPVIAGGVGPTYFHAISNRAAGTICVSASGANAGYVSYWDQPIFASDCTTIEPSDGSVHGRFVFHQLRHLGPEIARLRRGAAQPHVYPRDLALLELRMPPIEEQRRIAAALDRVDELRAKRQATLSRVDSLTRSIFFDMFGDPVTNSHRLPTVRLNSICKLVRGSSPRPQGDARYFGGPVLRLMVGDVTRDGLLVTPRIDSLTLEGAKRSRPVPASTIVMAVSGNVGVVSQLAVDACIHDGFVAFTLLDESQVRPLFLLYTLHLSRSVHRKSTAGAIFQNLTTTDVNRLELVVPTIASQDAFIERIAAVRSVTEKLLMTSSALDALLASLRHRAFSGVM